jgi:hypothetical protein
MANFLFLNSKNSKSGRKRKLVILVFVVRNKKKLA